LRKKRPSIELPDSLDQEIAALVDSRGRDKFVREAIRQELERCRLLASIPKQHPTRHKAAQQNGRLRP
jgi:metal-responsive CopG/Arc/MetJ family transcriptional regulator